MTITKAVIVIRTTKRHRKVCPICERVYYTNRRNRIYCGDKCAREGAYRRRAFGWYSGKDKPEEGK